MRINFKEFLATVEGPLLPDRSSVPGKSRLNTSIFPRTRYKANPNFFHPHLACRSRGFHASFSGLNLHE